MPLFDIVIEITVTAKSPQDAAEVVAEKVYVQRRPIKAVVFQHSDGSNVRPKGVMILPPGTLLSSIGEPLDGDKIGGR